MSDGPRLYISTPLLTDATSFVVDLDLVLSAVEVAAVRLRSAAEDEDAIRRMADQCREVCHSHDVALVLTDHVQLAQMLGLDGVHLANPRISVRQARKTLGNDAIIGAFGGMSRHDGMTLAEAGADYVALGPVAGGALGDGALAGPELFEWWAEMIETPSVAEGGVTSEVAAKLAEHADFIAADAAVWDHPDGPAAGAKAISAAIG